MCAMPQKVHCKEGSLQEMNVRYRILFLQTGLVCLHSYTDRMDESTWKLLKFSNVKIKVIIVFTILTYQVFGWAVHEIIIFEGYAILLNWVNGIIYK